MKYSKGLTIAGVLIVVAILLVAVSGPILSSLLKNYIEKNENVEVESIHVNVFLNSVTLDKIKLTTIVLGGSNVSGIIKSIKIDHLGWMNYLFRKDVSVGTINISDALLEVELLSGNTSDSISDNSNLPSISIGEIDINNSHLSISTHKKDSMMLGIEGLTFSEIEYINSTIVLNELSFRFGESNYRTANGQYHLGWSQAVCLPGENIITIDSISVIPIHETKQFFSNEKYQTDRFSLLIPRTEILTPTKDLNSNSYSFKGVATLQSGHLQVTRDKNKSRKENDLKPTLQEVLKSSPFTMEFDSLILESFKISYGEIAENESLFGFVTFDSLDATLKNVKAGDLAEGKLAIDAQTLLMNSGKLNATFEFPYDENYFDCKGTLNDLDFVKLNLVSEPLAKVSFSNGKINNLMFNFRADTDSSRGDLLFYYSNLNFAIASNAKGDTMNLKSRVLSFIADDLIVSDGNPDKNGNLSKGIIREARNKERFIFNYMWKSVFSGIKTTVLNNSGNGNKDRRKR